jgi:ribonucleoside-diphosphate reductase alpha chain
MLENVLIYSKVGCDFCTRAKQLLDNLGTKYTEQVLDPVSKQYQKKVSALVQKTNHKTFPQIFINDEFIGGFEELKKYIYRPTYLTYNVVKRNGNTERISFDKIVRRIDFLANYPSSLKGINGVDLAQSIISSIYDGIQTSDIDELLISAAANKGSDEPDYLVFAARLEVNNLHKKTLTSFKDKMECLYRNVDEEGNEYPLIDKKFFEFIRRNQKDIEQVIDYKKDYLFDYFGLKTLQKGYLQKIKDKIVERPQDMIMRISIFLHFKSKQKADIIKNICESYSLMSSKLFTHASPTIFNSGLTNAGCISCFLIDTDDSTDGIAHTVKSCMNISKACGGIGLSVSKWRSKHSSIKGSNGTTQGIVPFMQLLESTGRAFNQSSKREGKIALYLDMHHPDIISFIRTKFNTGNENEYCKDLSIALWVSDLFMKRVRDDKMWSMFNPQHHPELLECYGEEYETLYENLEERGLYRSQMPAREIWKEICIAQGSSGMPYILFKDQVNRTSNQKNVGIVRTSNLCAEIVEVSNTKDGEFACCTLASIALSQFVKDFKFDYEKLEKVMKVVVRNLNNVIDDTFYPTKETERSNKRHRPLGIGVQGLADVFCMFKYSYDSNEAAVLNSHIFEHMYYYALKASYELSREIYEKRLEQIRDQSIDSTYTQETLPKTIGAYSTFEGSPLSKGILNFDHYPDAEIPLSISEEKWNELRENVKTYGVRNSLLLACMPTASTSNILGNTEGFEPITNNIFVRVTLSGEFVVINKYLVEELKDLKLWTPEVISKIKSERGSIANITSIPKDVRDRYKTVWEISQRAIIELAAGRQRFICQSQSMNLHFSKLSLSKFTTAMFLAWSKGLKTGVYYMRSQGAAKPDTSVITGKGASNCCEA